MSETAVYRQLWTERDQRVPRHRRIDFEGRPTVEDIAAQIRAEGEAVDDPTAELSAVWGGKE